jgi:hypothetical protein
MTVVRLLLLVIGLFNLAIGVRVLLTVVFHFTKGRGSKSQPMAEDTPMED